MTTSRERSNGHDKNTGTNGNTATEDRSYYQDAYTFWGDFYQRMADEGMEFFQKGMEMAQSMTPMYADNEAFRIWKDSYQDFFNGMASDRQPISPMDPLAYQKMYDFWLETSSRAFEAYMRTPEFASKSGKGLEAFSDMSAKSGEALETYWHFLHLPSSQDMREIYQKLYTVERKLDEMDKRLREKESKRSKDN